MFIYNEITEVMIVIMYKRGDTSQWEETRYSERFVAGGKLRDMFLMNG